MDEPVKSTPRVTQPYIFDLGRRKAKKLKEFKKGEGALWDEVQAAVAKVHDELGEAAEGKLVVPVIMIFEKKPKRQRLDKLIFP